MGETPPLGRTSFLVGVCAFAYLYVFPYQSGINNPNENVRLYMTAALVEEGRYEIDGMRERWGWVNDAAKKDGHLYSVKAPGTSFLGVPGYALYLHATSVFGRPYDRAEALWMCRLTASIVPVLVWLFFLHRWLGRRSLRPELRDAVFLSVALGSLLYAYALLFVSHTLSAVCAFGAFMLLSDIRAGRAPTSARLFGAGLLAAGTTSFEYPGFVASVVLSIYALFLLRSMRLLASFAGGAAVPTLAVMHFQWRAFGSPFTPGHLYVETTALREAHHQGLYGATGPSAEALYGLTLDPAAGLFPLTPILVFALLGFVVLVRDPKSRADASTAIALVVLTLLAIASMNNWRGGWTIGPRYLALAVPFVAWGALAGLERVADRLGEGHTAALALGCTLAGFVASGLPSAYYPHLPPELTRPLPHLIWLLVGHGYAPHNAGALVGVHATASMLPLFAAFGIGLVSCLGRVAGSRAGAFILALALAVAAALLLPLHTSSGDAGAIARARAFVTGRWTPAGHDVAARLSRELRSRGTLPDPELRRLADLYDAEGRARDARRARAGLL